MVVRGSILTGGGFEKKTLICVAENDIAFAYLQHGESAEYTFFVQNLAVDNRHALDRIRIPYQGVEADIGKFFGQRREVGPL